MGNPFKHMGDAFKHAGDAVKHGAEDAGHTISDTGKDVGHGDFDKAGHDIKHDSQKGADHAKHSADKIGDDLEKQIMTTVNDIKHLGDQIKGDVKHDFDQLTSELRHTGDLCRNGLRDLGGQVRDEIRKDGDALKGDLQKVADDEKAAWKAFGEELEEELSSGTVKQALEKADKVVKWLGKKMDALEAKNPALVDTLNGISDVIEIGPINLKYSCFYSRVRDISDVLDKALKEDIKVSRTFLIELMTDLGPTSVTVNADLEVFATFGDKIPEMPMLIFTEIADEILEEIGVPA